MNYHQKLCDINKYAQSKGCRKLLEVLLIMFHQFAEWRTEFLRSVDMIADSGGSIFIKAFTLPCADFHVMNEPREVDILWLL